MRANKTKMTGLCFSKKLLVVDYVIIFILIAAFMVFTTLDKDTTNLVAVILGWAAQLGLSTGFYYWKAKSENLIKMPIQMLFDLPEDMKEKADPNQIIASVLGMKD